MKLHFWIIHDFLPVFHWMGYFFFSLFLGTLYRASMREYEGLKEKKSMKTFFRWLCATYVKFVTQGRKSSWNLYVLSSRSVFASTHPFAIKRNVKRKNYFHDLDILLISLWFGILSNHLYDINQAFSTFSMATYLF